ncbi:DNA polymerase III subunit gamma/tau [Anaerotignum sp. MB30-C6]|uniref:DNA polymerase III subunit gamma/tau n=1 Tax=Anaerotignum sp. MB30-C6 TaxID=3070814 RepID=UPI0027DE6148|nr:DNA polymerase III subunit gamma/tau [Anaerotignum sp. MB30-C6]WMI81229.1 DNA polymerase III subunit gamma/tau [Anaerotignum sp. MB30-C6]
MSYTALYRKFRPNTFSGVIGQEHIVKTLKNQMKTGRVSHAYLFCGTRGTGKTSTAKIFARAINCLSPTEEGEPCNECALCLDILQGRSVNVIEIDAASNNSVDNVREIREEVKYPPTQGYYKVYIIDEVHMLSNSAFNALLKTLEEPPAHVIFILATTDPQKVPATILSRCQRFDFRRITTDDIAETLMGYLEQEGQDITPEAVRYVAQLGDGSMRDSLSILDQCIAFYSGDKVTLEMVLDVMGAVDQRVLFEMTEALGKKDSRRVMELVEEMMISGRDVKQFVSEYLVHLRNFLMVSTIPNASGILDLSEENLQRLKGCSAVLSPQEAIFLIERFSYLQSDMRYSSNDRILLEVELLRLCSPWSQTDVTALAARIAGLERQVAQGVKVQVQQVEGKAEKKEAPKPKKKPPALAEDRKKLKEEWPLLRNEVDDVILKSQLKQVDIAFKEDDCIYLVCAYAALVDMLHKNMEQVEGLLEKASGKSFELRTVTKEEYDRWYETTYGKAEEGQEDAEFTSLLGSYFPEADFQE